MCKRALSSYKLWFNADKSAVLCKVSWQLSKSEPYSHKHHTIMCAWSVNTWMFLHMSSDLTSVHDSFWVKNGTCNVETYEHKCNHYFKSVRHPCLTWWLAYSIFSYMQMQKKVINICKNFMEHRRFCLVQPVSHRLSPILHLYFSEDDFYSPFPSSK